MYSCMRRINRILSMRQGAWDAIVAVLLFIIAVVVALQFSLINVKDDEEKQNAGRR